MAHPTARKWDEPPSNIILYSHHTVASLACEILSECVPVRKELDALKT